MLTEIFGMEWYKVHDEAEQLEHAVSADFERRLLEKLGTGKLARTATAWKATLRRTAANVGWSRWTRLRPRRRPRGQRFRTRSPAAGVSARTGHSSGAAVRIMSANYDDTLTLRIARQTGATGQRRGSESLGGIGAG